MERRKLAEKRYRRTEKGKLTAKRKRVKYRQSEKGKLVRKRQNAKYGKSEKGRSSQARRRIRDRKKSRSREILYVAIRAGQMIRPEFCSECDGSGDIEAHHQDYSKPLEVTWLCRSCHRMRHSKWQ